MSDKDAGAALAEVIGGGVVPRSELGDRLAGAGYQLSATAAERHVQMDTRFFEMGDGVGYLPGLTEGVAFTVWVDPATAEEDYLLTKPALDVISWWLVECPVDVFDESGKRIGTAESDGWLIDGVDTDVVVGPDGWLDGFADSWVAFRVRQGTLVLERLAGPPPADPARAAAVRSAFDAVAKAQQYLPQGSDEPVEVMRSDVSTVLQEAISANRSLFSGDPLPGAADLLTAARLRIEGYWVVPADLDPEIFAAAEAERLAIARWGVDAEDVRAAHILLGAITLHSEGSPIAFGTTPDEEAMAPLLFEAILERQSIARVIAYECSDADMCEAAKGLAEQAVEAFEGDPNPWALRWLVAHCQLVLGEIDSAAMLLDGLPSGIDHLPVLIDRARLAIERSEAKEAHKLLRAAEGKVDDLPDMTLLTYIYRQMIDEMHEEVELWASTAPGPMARRNERCPCGSGRKYKVCHLGRELHPIEDRAAWLYQKLTRFVREAEAEEIDSLAWVMADAMDSTQKSAELAELPFIPDLVLHEEQVEQRFLDGRLATLPEDEVLLAQQWMLVDRSVFEVQSADDGVLALYDIATGDAIEVTNLGDGPPLTTGMIVIGRPLPIADTYRALSGFMTLRPDLVRGALSALDAKDPDELVEMIGSMYRPPAVRNTDGEDLELADITWSIPEGADVTDALDRAGFTDDGGAWTLTRDTANQSNAVIASLRLDGQTIVGSVNSVERAEELLGLVAEHLPDAVHINTEVLDFDDVDETDVPALPDQAEMLANPEIRAAMEAHMANYEQEWLDSPIPALDGRTPREAAADPIAREDLVRLLASFPEVDEGGVGMSPQRLQAALGL